MLIIGGSITLDNRLSSVRIINLNNKKNTTTNYVGHIYKCPITEVVVPIVPTAENPTQHEERRVLVESYQSTISDETKVINATGGAIQTATISIDSNGVLGAITIIS